MLNFFMVFFAIYSQIVVRAHDLGTPQMTSQDSATVTVRVQRNKNCPQFQGTPYSKTIDQTQGVNSQVMKIQATDADPQNTPFRQVAYTLLGDDKGPTFFRIDEKSGQVYVKSDLKSDGDTQYKVNVGLYQNPKSFQIYKSHYRSIPYSSRLKPMFR